MIWYPAIWFLQIVGFQHPIIEAASTTEASPESLQNLYRNPRSVANRAGRKHFGFDYYSGNSDLIYYDSTGETYSRDYYSNKYVSDHSRPHRPRRPKNRPNKARRLNARHPTHRSGVNSELQFNDVPAMPHSLPFSALGVAIIHSHKLGAICSGVHLKPWILLTVADCVYRKYPEDLYAQVIKWDEKNSTPITFHAGVDFYVTHPGYRYSNYKSHNLAILVLTNGSDWDVEEFTIPQEPKGKDFNSEKLITYVNEWDELRTPRNRSYILAIEKKFASTNFTACKGQKPDPSFFCVSDGYHDVYEQIDVGIPLFYRVGASKVLLGLYTGDDLNNGVLGHMFLSIYENVYWIAEKIFEYPLPPSVN